MNRGILGLHFHFMQNFVYNGGDSNNKYLYRLLKFSQYTAKGQNKLRLSWAKLKFSLELSTMLKLFLTQLELKLQFLLSYHYYSWWAGGSEKKEINAILNSVEVEVEVEV